MTNFVATERLKRVTEPEKQPCQVCDSDPQFKAIFVDFNKKLKLVKACRNCFESIKRMEKRERRRKRLLKRE